MSDITINGTPAVLDGDTFQSNIGLARGINRVEVRGTDGRGDSVYKRHSVIAGDYADPESTLREGLNLRLNQGGLDITCDLLSEAIKLNEISTAVAGTQVYDEQFDVLGWSAAEMVATLQQLSFDSLDADLEPSTNSLHLTLEIPNLDTLLNAQGEVLGLDFDVDAFVWADVVTIESDIVIDTNKGQLDVAISDPSILMTGFGYDTSLIPTSIETFVFVDEVRTYLEEMLVEQIEAMVPALIDEQLETLDLSFETELMDQKLSLAAEFASVEIDHNGLALAVDVDIDVGTHALHEGPGYLSAPSEAPQLSTKSDLAIGLTDDVFNRILYGIWQAGVLDMTMSTADGSLSETVTAMLKSEEATVVIRPALPPVMIQRDGALTLEVGELWSRSTRPMVSLETILKRRLAARCHSKLSVRIMKSPLTLATPISRSWFANRTGARPPMRSSRICSRRCSTRRS